MGMEVETWTEKHPIIICPLSVTSLLLRRVRRAHSGVSAEALPAGMRAVLSVFENYQKARVNFVQTVAELATRPQNIEALQNAGVMQLLRPLLLDNVPSIQQSAALALGRLANYNDELAEAVVSNEVLPQLVYSLSEQNRFYKKAAAFVLRAVAKHSPQLAQAVVDSGALDALVAARGRAQAGPYVRQVPLVPHRLHALHVHPRAARPPRRLDGL